LLCEGTRITEGAGDSEQNVEEKITELVRGCDGLVMADWGWKDTARFETLLAVARTTNRTLLISPKLAYLWNLLHQSNPAAYPTLDELGNVRVYLKRSNSTLYSPSDYAGQKYKMGYAGEWDETAKQQLKDAWLSHRLESAGDLATHYVSAARAYDVAQEPAKYILQGGFFDIQELCDLDAPTGSLFIRAATEPFCEEMRIDEEKLQNWLTHFGFNATEEALPRAHVSGHANGEDLLNWVREMEPRQVIPIHTEHPEVFEEELTCEVRQAEYGVGMEF
jgi:ribonuclease J